MPTLRDVQQAFGAALISDDAAAVEFVIDDGIAAENRLNIYRNTGLGNLVGALRISYPAVRKLVGDEFFEGACRAFIDAHPPRSAYLNEYGTGFADFLAEFPPADSIAYLADVARVEWAVTAALHADDAASLDVTTLAGLPEDADPVFVTHPSVSLVTGDSPADAIWRAVIEDDETGLATIQLDQGPVFLVVSRGADGVAVARLSEEEWRFTQMLFASAPLSWALATVNTDMSACLAAHLAAGRFIAIQERDPA